MVKITSYVDRRPLVQNNIHRTYQTYSQGSQKQLSAYEHWNVTWKYVSLEKQKRVTFLLADVLSCICGKQLWFQLWSKYGSLKQMLVKKHRP